MINVKIKIDERHIRAIERKLGNKKGPMKRVLNGAINATAKKGHTAVVADVKRELGSVSTTSLKRRIRLIKGRVSQLGAQIKVYAKRFGLIEFGARQGRKGKKDKRGRKITRGVAGVSYQIGSARKVLPHGFIAEANNSRQVWHRAQGAGPSGLVGRYPLIRMKGPSAGRVEKKTPGLLRRHERAMDRDLKKQIESKIQWLLNKK